MKCVQNKVYPSEISLRSAHNINNHETNDVHVIRTTSASRVSRSATEIVIINVDAVKKERHVIKNLTSLSSLPNTVEDLPKASSSGEMKILTKLEEKFTEKMTPRSMRGLHDENEALFNNSKNEQDTTIPDEYIELNNYDNESTNEKANLLSKDNTEEKSFELSLCGDEDPAYSCSQSSLRDEICMDNSDINNNSVISLKFNNNNIDESETVNNVSGVKQSYDNPTLERGESLVKELELKYDNYVSPEPDIIDQNLQQDDVDDDAIELASLCEGENPMFSSSQALLRDEEFDANHVTEETSFMTHMEENHEILGRISEIPDVIPEEMTTEEGDPAEGTPEHFIGSLGIQVMDDPWVLDVDRQLNADYEEEDWDSYICERFANAKDAKWNSAFNQIEANKKSVELDWKATINPISTNENRNTTWRLEIENNIKNAANDADWKTNLNDIKKSSESKWSCTINEIAKRVPSKNEWKSRFNDMFRRTSVDTWTAKLPKTKVRYSQTDWTSKFHKLEAPSLATDPWSGKMYNDFNSPVDDVSYYKNELNSMASLREEGQWRGGSFKDIRLQKYIDKTWKANLTEIAQNKKTESWKNSLSTIAKYEVKERDWTASMKEILLDSNAPQRWKYEILNAHFPLGNTSWTYTQHEIAKRGDSLVWESKFIEADLSGMNHSQWEQKFNAIKNSEEEPNWEVKGEMIEVMNPDVFRD